MSRGRSLVGNLLALVCMGALLIPNALHAKSTKRSPRSGQKRVSKPKAPPSPSVRSATRAKPVAAARKAVARRARRPERRPEQGLRGSVDEHVHVRRGDTVEAILSRRGVGLGEAYDWIGAAADVYDLRKIRPRHGLTLRFDRETRVLESIRYEIDGKRLLIAESAPSGITARVEDLPYFVEVKGVAGQIEHGLRQDTVTAGVPARVAAELADIFGWDVDVENGLHPGDEFRVIYENIWQVGMREPQAGKVLAAEFVTDGTRRTAVLFEDELGNGAYYRPDGGAVSRRFLRFPVEFTEISSEYSLDRFHPIRRRRRPHLGVDFAAPRGTPVLAAADGVVSEAEREQGLGQTVRIDHEGGLTSTYGHLSHYAPGIRPGVAVERGRVIGYVGSTGLSTGPHLHYELTRAGEHMNPMSFAAEPEPAIGATLARQFERTGKVALRQLAGLPRDLKPTSLSLSTSTFQAME